ncbi:endo alpha-1,4 polygalactosaminidase [Agrococcus sp. SL85]|uniref:endo alpha-1,4 polygalactosaminidase n=1 Tax=Agrococcus sp. SL85 TaxID=2995141 RepID=UPI00226CD9AD|nr:endo alpha-1,4 polygalactosaminidase [Agrococcus sp. SL85]WAC65722.1 endo alpha-1,4 polygalactosaminidase [Agrococcus sp. SL85]
MRRRAAAALASLLAAALLAACGAQPPGGAAGGRAAFDESAFAALWAEAEAGGLDYQLGGAYEPDRGVTVVARDREATPAGVVIDVCYVNGFQTQPGELAEWEAEHPELLLRDAAGEPVVDPAWPDERILDTSTAERREAIAEVVGTWIDGCADAGYEAVELDNLDTWTRAEGLTQEGNLALAALLVDRAHAAGLAAAQKNALEAGEAGPAAGFDLVVTEECAAFDECAAYSALHERHLAVEYDSALPVGETFADVCAREDQPVLTVLRDIDLAVPGDPAHVVERC